MKFDQIRSQEQHLPLPWSMSPFLATQDPFPGLTLIFSPLSSAYQAAQTPQRCPLCALWICSFPNLLLSPPQGLLHISSVPPSLLAISCHFPPSHFFPFLPHHFCLRITASYSWNPKEALSSLGILSTMCRPNDCPASNPQVSFGILSPASFWLDS